MADDLFSDRDLIAPPGNDQEACDWLRLIRSRRVGPSTFYRLLREHGSARAALGVLPEIARDAGVRNYAACPPEVAEAEISRARARGAHLLCFGAAGYPQALREVTDAPPVLWARGELSLLSRPMIAIVGARNASSLGTRMARRLAQELGAEGYVIVSGLARGVDTAAHRAALPTGTAAVFAGGLEVTYPAENTALADEIFANGVALSEQPPGLQPQARHFPQRNRIISGMSQGIIVVEAALKSGSLITARNALDQGREVMAVPGHPVDARASGCNALIRDGATLVRGARDVMDAISGSAPGPVATVAQASPAERADPAPVPQPVPPTAPPPAPPQRSPKDTRRLHDQILSRLGPSPLAADQLIRDLGLPAHRVTSELTTLELDGRIEQKPGGLLARIGH